MGNRLSRVSFITMYIALFLASVISILSFEISIEQDRKGFKKPFGVSLDLVVESVPDVSEEGIAFVASVWEGAICENMLYVYIREAQSITLYPGDRITVTGELNVPDKALNHYGFDFAKTVKSMGASLVIYSDISKISNHHPTSLAGFYSLRNKVSRNMYRNMSNEEAALCDAIVTGNRSNIDSHMTDVYKSSGIYHIIAVSGLHLGMLLIFLAVVYSSPHTKFRKRSVLKFIFTFTASIFLLFFTGFGVSVWRCALMAMMLSSAMLITREYSPFVSLYIIANILIVTKPSLYLSPAMQLSFSATLGILCGSAFLVKVKSYRWKFKEILSTFILCQFAFVFTLPVMSYTFGGVSVAGIFCNVIVISMAPFLLGFAYVYSVISLFAPDFICTILSDILSVVALSVNTVAELFAETPLSYVEITFETCLIAIAELIALFLIFRIRKSRLVAPAILLFILANVIPLTYNVNVDKVSITFINAGQGDSTLIKDSHGGTFMIDCGSNSHLSIGSSEVVPYLKGTGTDSIDILFITHYHSDHTNGVQALMEENMVKKILLPRRNLCPDETEICLELHALANRYKVKVEYVSQGDIIEFSERNIFRILNPTDTKYSDANDGSMVIEYRHGDRKVLFCGDIEENGQRMVADNITDCDIIKIAHHGGYCSTGFMVAARAKAEYAVVSCGKDNSFKHPSPATVTAYSNSEIFSTEDGPVVFEMEKNKINVR